MTTETERLPTSLDLGEEIPGTETPASDVLIRAETDLQTVCSEMIDQGVHGWPNTLNDVIESLETLRMSTPPFASDAGYDAATIHDVAVALGNRLMGKYGLSISRPQLIDAAKAALSTLPTRTADEGALVEALEAARGYMKRCANCPLSNPGNYDPKCDCGYKDAAQKVASALTAHGKGE